MGTIAFFKDLEFGGRHKVKDFVFEEESISIPESIHINITSPIQDEIIVHEEQTQHPHELVQQEQVSLLRFTRISRNSIPDDYIMFFQEHEENDGKMDDDPINFHQAMQSSNLEKYIEVMNEEYKSMVLGTCPITKRSETHWL